jgi:hypothetical protein
MAKLDVHPPTVPEDKDLNLAVCLFCLFVRSHIAYKLAGLKKVSKLFKSS